jgi:hypothetical protein
VADRALSQLKGESHTKSTYTIAFWLSLPVAAVAGAGDAGNRRFLISVDSRAWAHWGFRYPVTYVFRLASIPAGARVKRRDDLLAHLRNIPYGRHVFEHILTSGYRDETILATDEDEFLFVRGFNGRDNPSSCDFSPWDAKHRYYGPGGSG